MQGRGVFFWSGLFVALICRTGVDAINHRNNLRRSDGVSDVDQAQMNDRHLQKRKKNNKIKKKERKQNKNERTKQRAKNFERYNQGNDANTGIINIENIESEKEGDDFDRYHGRTFVNIDEISMAITTTIKSSLQPINAPSPIPTPHPTSPPSDSSHVTLMSVPSLHPSEELTSSPSNFPSKYMSGGPSKAPSATPSLYPSGNPSALPTATISASPSMLPSTSSHPTEHKVCGGLLPNERKVKIETKLLESFHNELHDHALNWIINVDARALCPDDDSLNQRYALSAIYFDTNGYDWKDGNVGSDAWLSSGTECGWFGITCNNMDYVNKIFLGENNLKGTIPKELASFVSLRELRLNDNYLSGPFPSLPGSLFDVKLYNNQLTGELPDTWPVKLIRLQISNNNFSGSINSIPTATRMRQLDLHGNNFSGTVSVHFGSLRELASFQIHQNNLTGIIPDDVCILRSSLLPQNRLSVLTADCASSNPIIQCESMYLFGDVDCCSECY
mmetsp:Transcript_31558/g.46236  ORF Transcript_31558/g.46236 Transcript_31558/m.46236 type:complete len:504 (+) Transcript_31558:31-1542(+)